MAMTKRTLTEEEQKILEEFMAAYTNMEAAELLDVNKSAVSFWRNGKTVPKATMILKMRKILSGETVEPEKKPETETVTEEDIVAAKREYHKNWRAENKDKVKARNERYWEKQAANKSNKSPIEQPAKKESFSEEDEATFCYIFRTFIANIDKGDFDSIKVKEAVDLARRLLNDKMVDGILVDRILRR